MISNILQIGNKIELSRRGYDSEGNIVNKVYASRLMEFVDELTMDVAVPFEGGRLIPLEVGSKYEARFMSQNGMYLCQAEITGRFKQGTLFFLRMKILTELKKDQRRQFFRLDRIIFANYHIISLEEQVLIKRFLAKDFANDWEFRQAERRYEQVKGDTYKGMIVNISGGGVKLVTDIPLEKDMQLFMDFALYERPDEPLLNMKGRVVHAEQTKNNNNKYENRIEFIDVSATDRETIVRFVFTEERKMRKKENGT